MNESTTIKLHLETVKRLTGLKKYPRETYEDVILRLMERAPANANGKKR